MAVVGKVLLYIFVDYVSPFLFFGVGLVVFCVCGLFLGVFIQMFTAVSFRFNTRPLRRLLFNQAPRL